MEIRVTHEQGRNPVTVLHPSGEINAQTAPQLEAEARRVVEEGAQNLLLDLSHVDYISSAGLRALQSIFNLFHTAASSDEHAAMHRGLRDGSFKSANLKLLNPNANVMRVLETSGFDMFLEVHKDLAKAVASF